MTENGVFVGNSPSEVLKFEQWLGGPVDSVLGYIGNANWSDFTSGWADGLWSELDRPINWSVPLIVNGTNLAEAASGAYDGYWRTVALQLADNRPQDATIDIRTGWEFNGGWFPWTAHGGQEDEFAAAFRRFVDVVRSVEGGDRFRFEWNIASGDFGIDVEKAYPGDAWVDVVGIDFYWNPEWEGTDPLRAWDREVNQSYGLKWLEDFAAAHGKPTAYSEWGVPAGIDASLYIAKVKEWFESHNVALHHYWDDYAGSNYDGKLSDGSDPLSGAAYKAAFGPGSTTTPPPTTTPPAATPPAGATVLGFDEVSLADGGEQPILSSYGGFTWVQAGLHNPTAGSGYTTSSGANLAFLGEAGGYDVAGYAAPAGSPMIVKRADGADFTFHGASFSSAWVDGLRISAQAYDDGALVGTFSVTANRGAAPFVSFDGVARFSSIDELRLSAPNYFGMDSFAFGTEAATRPPPALPAPTYAKDIIGNRLANTLNGGAGHDRIEGGGGNDTVTGGAGADVFIFARGTASDVVTDFQTGVDKLVFQGFSAAQIQVTTTSGGLRLTNPHGDAVTLRGVTQIANGDVLGGPAHLRGTDGADTLDRSAATGPAKISGLAGNDVLKGGAGADWLVGGAGADVMTGGAGRDGFVLFAGSGADRIMDFASGADRLVLRGVDPGSVTAAWSSDGGAAGISIGYGTAGDSVFLAGVTALSAGDLVFA
jgi:Ca2+-binding RTX toxin-like protein